MSFSTNFRWGASSASYQIEGAWQADDKGLSVWDQMSRWPGKILNGDTGDVTCDHYHLYKEDVALMKKIGLNAYRFSLSWPRIIPGGTGKVSEKGLGFYDRLVDELLAAGVEPWITLFHWDYPLELYYRGGWLNSESPAWFEEYTEAVVKRLGDRVKHWITLNETSIFVVLGHELGIHAPGLRLPPADIVRIIHHVLKAHGRSIDVIQHEVPTAQTGWASATGVVEPLDPDNPQHVQEAYDAQFALLKVGPGGKDTYNFGMGSGIWNDPVFLGTYPEDYVKKYGHFLPKGWENDMKNINKPLSFCGMNIYNSWTWTGDGKVSNYKEMFGTGTPTTHFNWPITPSCLYWGPKHFYKRYNIPIVITENGIASHDWVHTDGKIHDSSRIDFLRRYLSEFKRATEDGVETLGYFQWSLTDNFEWAEGYRCRFGLIHVDYNTQKRTLKDSAHWYANVIKSNGAEL